MNKLFPRITFLFTSTLITIIYYYTQETPGRSQLSIHIKESLFNCIYIWRYLENQRKSQKSVIPDLNNCSPE